ncbi:metal ABC transporter substrate-binding protein [bacterium]|jgi:manganese/iron transport system substrate-binding protein|nr:metal ABC transporter substrate-binding protein [bacterium]MBT3850166.1 metal ABC transporter substrate-binding protein [bacterium]|tara:strand:- start:2489 stop:3391 length:903 start_codon:yes stop_codon:yes gene_type:complete
MKILNSVLLIIIFLFAMGSDKSVVAEEKFKVVTTFTIFADMASNIAGDKAVIVSITKPGADIHTYQPTPRDILKAQNADLILWNGLNLELWFEKFFSDIESTPSVVLTQGIKPMGITKGPYKGKPNPHAWMSPNDGLIYIENIRKALVRHDPNNSDVYNKNAAIYSNKLKLIIAPIRKKFSSIPLNKRWLVTSEGAFSYLIRDFDLKELYLWPMNADSQGTPSQVRNVIDKIRENRIGVIFSESTISPKPAIQVASEAKIKYGGVLYVDSLSEEDGPVPTYLDLLRVTTERIVKGIVDSL